MRGWQVKEVRGQEVTCIAQNDSQLDGLLTLVHQERSEEFGMSSLQASLCKVVAVSVCRCHPSPIEN